MRELVVPLDCLGFAEADVISAAGMAPGWVCLGAYGITNIVGVPAEVRPRVGGGLELLVLVSEAAPQAGIACLLGPEKLKAVPWGCAGGVKLRSIDGFVLQPAEAQSKKK